MDSPTHGPCCFLLTFFLAHRRNGIDLIFNEHAMTVSSSGDSIVTNLSDNLFDNEAFGFSDGDATGTTKTTAEPELVPESTDIQEEEGTTPAADDSADDTSTSEEAGTSESEQDKEERKRLEDAHVLIVNTIEDQFKSLDKGEMTPAELKMWFEKNPEFADVANRSKRMKERYRGFIESSKDLSTDTPSTEKPESKPLTIEDLKAYEQEREASLLKKQYERQNNETLTTFAVDRGIKDDEVQKLRTTADALLATNDEWSYKNALEAAHRALYGNKSAPVGVPSGRSSATPTTPTPQPSAGMDGANWVEAVSAKDFMG